MSSENDVLALAKTAFKAGQLTTKPLFAVDPLALAQVAFGELEKKSFDVAPVDDGGSYYRYVQREWLPSEGKVQDFAAPIEAAHMIPSATPLADCLKKLTTRAWYFVLENEEVTGLVTLADLQKPALSLFAFANVLAIEGYLKSTIAAVEDWMTYLTLERLAKLQEIHEVRRRHNIDTNISDALTIEDKMRLATKLRLHELMGFNSVTEFNRWAEEAKRLRDVLAHGGSVLDQDPDPMKAIAQVLGFYDLAIAVIQG